MPPTSPEDRIETICHSDRFAIWVDELTACFGDDQAKNGLIGRVRDELADDVAGLAETAAEDLRKGVVDRLVGLAKPQRPAAPAPQDTTQPEPSLAEIDRLIIGRFPYPVAYAYKTYVEAAEGFVAMWAFRRLLDTLENLLHYLATVALSSYWRHGAWDREHSGRVLELFLKEKWVIGNLQEMLRDTTRLFIGRAPDIGYPAMVPALFLPGGGHSAFLNLLEEMVSLRNTDWGHAESMTEAQCAEAVRSHGDRFARGLGACDWLAQQALWLPTEIDDSGKVLSARPLNGNTKGRAEASDIYVRPEDLERGFVIANSTLLLMAPTPDAYLPLFPLSLYYTASGEQGPRFLNGIEWTGSPRQPKRAVYVAHDDGHGDSVGRYVCPGGDKPCVWLAERVEFLRASAGETDGGSAAGAIDHDLAEVWVEQQGHIRSFVGRRADLDRLHEWATGGERGGYLLLGGPPGQGKSALLAMFAHDCAAQGIPCLLHMVKSLKNPKRFMEFLLWQAGRAASEPLPPAAFEGDVEDLRDQLVKAVEKLRREKERVVIVIDALDELEEAGRSLTFLPRLPDGVRCVLSSQPDQVLLERLRNRLGSSLAERVLEPLSAADVPALLDEHLGAEMAQQVAEAVDTAALFAHTGGSPLFLKRAIEELGRMAQEARAAGAPLGTIGVETLPNTHAEVFGSIYREVSGKDQSGVDPERGRAAARMLQALAVAMGPMNADELRGVLRAGGTTLTLEDACDHLATMSKYLVAYEGDRYLPWHRGLYDHLSTHVLGDDGLADLHRAFAGWLQGRQQAKSRYRLEHLPAHLQESMTLSDCGGLDEQAAWAAEALQGLLTDLGFVRAKVEAGLVYELVRDYEQAKTALEQAGHETSGGFATWQTFVRGQSHILDREPELFVQQALNQPSESPASLAASEAVVGDSGPGLSCLIWLNRPRTLAASPVTATLSTFSDALHDVALSPDGRRVACAHASGRVRICDLLTGRSETTIEIGRGSVQTVSWTPDGALIGAAGSRGLVGVYEAQGGRCLWALDAPHEAVFCVAISPVGDILATGHADGWVMLWQVCTGAQHASFHGLDGRIYRLCWSPDARRLACSGLSDTVAVWDVLALAPHAEFVGHGERCRALAFHPRGGELLSGADDGVVRRWDLEGTRGPAAVHAADGRVWALSARGQRIVWGSEDGDIGVLGIDDGELLARMSGFAHTVKAVDLTRDGMQAVVAADETTAQVWDLHTPSRYACAADWSMRASRGAAVTPDGSRALSTGYGCTLSLWDVGRQTKLVDLRGHADAVRAVAISHDGARAISGGFCNIGGSSGVGLRLTDATVRVWDLCNGSCIGVFSDHTAPVFGAAIASDGSLGLTTGWDNVLRVWDLATMESRGALEGHAARGSNVAMSSDGQSAISASLDGTVRLWDLAAMKCAAVLTGHESTVFSVALARRADVAVSGGHDGQAKVWDLGESRCVRTISASEAMLPAVAISPDGRRALTGDFAGALKLWDLSTGRCLATFHGRGAILACEFNPDDESLFVAVDRSGRVYQLRLQ